MHPWANLAAEIAACGEKQNEDAFWSLHDFYFQEQGSLNEANLKKKIDEFVGHTALINQDQLTRCIADQGGDELVKRDLKLGNELQIRATPTIFINGFRQRSIRNVDMLSTLINAAAETSQGERKKLY